MTPALPRAAATQLLVIRTAMLAGLLVFGAVTWFTASRGRVATLAPEQARLFGYLFAGLAAAAVAGMIAIRSTLANVTDPKQIVTRYLIGYAFAEGAALFGGVVWYMGGAREWYIAGLILMVAGFQVLPINRRREDEKTGRRGGGA